MGETEAAVLTPEGLLRSADTPSGLGSCGPRFPIPGSPGVAASLQQQGVLRGRGWGAPPISVLLQTRPCPGSHRTPREASGPATHEGKAPDFPDTPGFASRGPGNSQDCNQYLGHPSSGLLVQMPTFQQDCPEPRLLGGIPQTCQPRCSGWEAGGSPPLREGLV